jgi:uncharacterized membrane-anchored protein YhcB (DUF1043 family)
MIDDPEVIGPGLRVWVFGSIGLFIGFVIGFAILELT